MTAEQPIRPAFERIVPERHYTFRDGVTLSLGKRTLIMGILNTTPDSFSDGGRYNGTIEAAVAHAKAMVADGADIIDIGGESTRPGFEPVPLEEEIRRVVPVIQAIRQELPQTTLSIDTYKAATARAALEAGAHILNDIWALRGDPEMAKVAGEYGAPIILNHNREDRNYGDFVADVIRDLEESVAIGLRHGIKREDIWLDPGIGFAKDYKQNLEMMANLSRLCEVGYPVLLGTSRKRFIRDTLQLPVDELAFGTAATVTLGIAQGCQIMRVHDVKLMKQNAMMADAIVYRS